MRSPGGTVPGGGYRRLGEEGRATCAALVWMRLGKRPGIEGIDQQEDSEPEPPKGERHKKLDEGAVDQEGTTSGYDPGALGKDSHG